MEFHPFAKSATRMGHPQLRRCELKNEIKGAGRSVRNAQEEMHRSFASLRMTK